MEQVSKRKDRDAKTPSLFQGKTETTKVATSVVEEEEEECEHPCFDQMTGDSLCWII